ncbi:hypothetical protein [Vibrio sp.]|uniref:hypothetical protein n=1 Tax=Vibrio sp. TaxID=678 RepID=UPI003AA93246
MLGYQVYRHILGSPQSTDKLIYEETDSEYYTYISKSKDGEEVYIWHSGRNQWCICSRCQQSKRTS